MSGRLFIVSGPSGAGKSSLCKAVLAQCDALALSISCTTRQPRPGEKDGREYHFLQPQKFQQHIANDAFLEWAKVHGNLYGTRQSDVETHLKHGRDVLLEIDWQGARQVAAKMPDAVRVFIVPPCIEALQERLLARGQDTADIVQQRVAAAAAEMSHANEAHHQVVNDVFDIALKELLDLFLKTNPHYS